MNINFNNLNLQEKLLDNLNLLNYTKMTPIQKESLPISLANNDLIAKAQTGSGKTIAFCIPVLNKLNIKNFRIQTMILAPTRELANQIAVEMKKLARFAHNIKITTLCGGMPYKPQVHSLSHQAHIIIGTPGRILKHLESQTFTSENISTLVLDEADRMLDMGFTEDINKIIDFLPKQRQTLLFSATYPANIAQLANNILNNPKTVEIQDIKEKVNIEEVFYKSEDSNKNNIIYNILRQEKQVSNIIFCNTKIACNELADSLEDNGVDVLVLHSDMEQKQRNETLILFANKSFSILIATDVASRGIDINDVNLVLNYDLPFDTEVYTHRIGRTARAGKAGKSISLVDYESMQTFNELNENNNLQLKDISTITYDEKFNVISPYATLFINSGKKHKLRAGDILGALTAGIGLNKDDVGKIDILDLCSFVAIKTNKAKKSCEALNNTKIKAKYHKIYLI
jgi:ATP-independent RNA helicase DbpA